MERGGRKEEGRMEKTKTKTTKEMKRYAPTVYSIFPLMTLHEGGVRAGNSTANGQ